MHCFWPGPTEPLDSLWQPSPGIYMRYCRRERKKGQCVCQRHSGLSGLFHFLWHLIWPRSMCVCGWLIRLPPLKGLNWNYGSCWNLLQRTFQDWLTAPWRQVALSNICVLANGFRNGLLQLPIIHSWTFHKIRWLYHIVTVWWKPLISKNRDFSEKLPYVPINEHTVIKLQSYFEYIFLVLEGSYCFQ